MLQFNYIYIYSKFILNYEIKCSCDIKCNILILFPKLSKNQLKK